MIEYVKVLFRGQITLYKNCFYPIEPCAKKSIKKNLNKNVDINTQ